MNTNALELADKIKAWREDEEDVEPMGHAFDLLNNDVEPYLRSIHTPLTDDFLEAVTREATFQIESFCAEHDDGKEPTDWLWLIGYLTGKATQAAIVGDIEKARHHTISTAAVLLNWHRRLGGEDQSFRPGIATPPVGTSEVVNA